MRLIMNNKRNLLLIVFLLIIISAQGLWAGDGSSAVRIGFNPEPGRVYRGTIEVGSYGGSKQIIIIMDISTRSLPDRDGFIAQRIESLKVSYEDELVYDSEHYEISSDDSEKGFLFNALLNKDLTFQMDSMGNLLKTPDIESLYPSRDEFEAFMGSASDYNYYFEDFTEIYNDIAGDLVIGKYTFPEELLFPGDSWYSAIKQSLNYDNFWTESYYTLDSIEDGKLDISIDGRILKDDGSNIDMNMYASLSGSLVIDKDSGMPIEQTLTTTQKFNSYWSSSTVTTIVSYRDRDSSEPFEMAKKLAMMNNLSIFNTLLERCRSKGGVISDQFLIDELNSRNIPMNNFLEPFLGSTPREFNKELFSESIHLASKGLGGDFWHVPERTFFKLDTEFQKADGSPFESMLQDEYLSPQMLRFIFGDSFEELFYGRVDAESFGLPITGRLAVLIESDGERFLIDKKHINTPDGYVEMLESGPGWAAVLVKGATAWSAYFTNCIASDAVCLAAYNGEALDKWDNSELVYILRAPDEEFIPEIQLSFSFDKEIVDLKLGWDSFAGKSYFPANFNPGYRSLTIDQINGAFKISMVEDEYSYDDEFTYTVSVPSYSNTMLARINFSDTLMQLFVDGELNAEFDPFNNKINISSSQELSGETMLIEYPLEVEICEYEPDNPPESVLKWKENSIDIAVDVYKIEDLKKLPLIAYWYDTEIFNSGHDSFYQHLIARPLNQDGRQLLASPVYIDTDDSVFVNLTHNDQMIKLQMDEVVNYAEFPVVFE